MRSKLVMLISKKTLAKTPDSFTTHENTGRYKKISDLYVAGSVGNIKYILIDMYLSSPAY